MENIILPTPGLTEAPAMPAPYITELSHERWPGHFGFRIGGYAAGPNIVISGMSPLAGRLFQRLLLLPSLSRLRGQLFLIQMERVLEESELDQVSAYLPEGTIIDAQIFLPFLNTDQMTDDMQDSELREAYWSVLRLCSDHGMISGRGVPPRTVAEPADFQWKSRRH